MKPKPLVELNHLTVPVVMMNPFIAIEKPQHSGAADSDSDFERKVRSERVASRAISKAQQANSITPYIQPLPECQPLVFLECFISLKGCVAARNATAPSPCFPRNPGAWLGFVVLAA